MDAIRLNNSDMRLIMEALNALTGEHEDAAATLHDNLVEHGFERFDTNDKGIKGVIEEYS